MQWEEIKPQVDLYTIKDKDKTPTENIIESNNLNLANQTVSWNDSGNANWYEQFIKVLNAVLGENEKFGKPIKSNTIDSIHQHSHYRYTCLCFQ